MPLGRSRLNLGCLPYRRNVKGSADLCCQIFMFVPILQFELHRTWGLCVCSLYQIFKLVSAFEIDADRGGTLPLARSRLNLWSFPYWALTLSFATRDLCPSTPPDLHHSVPGTNCVPRSWDLLIVGTLRNGEAKCKERDARD